MVYNLRSTYCFETGIIRFSVFNINNWDWNIFKRVSRFQLKPSCSDFNTVTLVAKHKTRRVMSRVAMPASHSNVAGERPGSGESCCVWQEGGAGRLGSLRATQTRGVPIQTIGHPDSRVDTLVATCEGPRPVQRTWPLLWGAGLLERGRWTCRPRHPGPSLRLTAQSLKAKASFSCRADGDWVDANERVSDLSDLTWHAIAYFYISSSCLERPGIYISLELVT